MKTLTKQTKGLSVVAEELLSIKAKHRGKLTPKNVVDDARSLDSPLHDRFEWDDSIAGEAHRLQQARELINTTVLLEPSVHKEPVKMFVSLSTDRQNGGGYHYIKDVLSDKQLHAQLLADAKRELEYFTTKYRQLSELKPLFKVIDKLLKKAA